MTNSDVGALPILRDQAELQGIGEAFASPMPPDHDIDISYFSHKTRKSTRLISNASENDMMRARREWLSFDLTEAIYITSIKITATGYEEYHEMELSLIDALSGEEIKEKRRFGGEGFLFEPKRFVSGFGLRPDQSWSFTKSQHIKRIDVRGLEQKNFFEVISVYDNANKERAKIEDGLTRYFDRARKAESEYNKNVSLISEQEASIAKNTSEISRLNDDLAKLSDSRDELTKRIEPASPLKKSVMSAFRQLR